MNPNVQLVITIACIIAYIIMICGASESGDIMEKLINVNCTCTCNAFISVLKYRSYVYICDTNSNSKMVMKSQSILTISLARQVEYNKERYVRLDSWHLYLRYCSAISLY